MKITSSYKVEIQKLHKPLKKTMEVTRSAVSWLVPVIDAEWDTLSQILNEKRRFNEAEKLIHQTRSNSARYPFDQAFPKMPSYLRRAVLQHVIGLVSSARTRGVSLTNGKDAPACPGAENQSEAGFRKNSERNHYMPVFYKDNMYRRQEDKTFLKLYNGKDWVWQEVSLKKTDLDYLRKYWSDRKAKSPVLVRSHRKYFLQFAFEEETKLTDKPVEEQVICAVDLGINTDAVCSIMRADGTVAARKFIDFAAEKDQLNHVLNRIREHQRCHGPMSVTGFWAYARRLNEELARKTANAIVRFAVENGADIIVFEHLEMKERIRGKNRQKLHMWKKAGVQKIVEHQAHRAGMRISRICAWKTSSLAFDGSGAVSRDPENHSLATFPSGKQYNCDLSASYNIGARYFVRELLKPVPETERSALAAKVPGVQRRTSCVYADLILLNQVMEKPA